MKPVFLALPGNEVLAARLASLLDGDLGTLHLHAFPDGETHLRLDAAVAGRPVILACTLDHPDSKSLPLFFAADTAHELGASSVGLVAPYLCYMRQDRRFQPGEAVTSRSFAGLVSGCFDWLVTVDPHLHRYKSLGDVYAIPAHALHAGPALAAWLRSHVTRPFLIGPDAESRQWIEAVASACDAPYDVLQKSRLGDRSVTIRADHLRIPAGATPVLLDDIIASGGTMLEALAALRRQTASPAVVVAIHCLAGVGFEKELARAGARLATTNTIPNQAARIDIAPILAAGLSSALHG